MACFNVTFSLNNPEQISLPWIDGDFLCLMVDTFIDCGWSTPRLGSLDTMHMNSEATYCVIPFKPYLYVLPTYDNLNSKVQLDLLRQLPTWISIILVAFVFLRVLMED